MKKIALITISILLVSSLIFNAFSVLAAKPPQVITMSNGFPSGFHFNLNIHGKDPSTFTCPTDSGGNSIFVPEYTADYDDPENPDDNIVIEMVSNKKASVYELTVLDACAMPASLGGDNTATVQLPYKIQPDELGPVIDANGYYVYARILGKPDNSKDTENPESNIILTPRPVLCIGNDTGDPAFPDYTSVVLPLGMVTSRGAYKMTDVGLERFDTDTTDSKGKGKSTAENITDLFMWTGWVIYDTSLDMDGDGDVDENDLDLYNAANDPDYATVDDWLNAINDPSIARYYEDWWVFDIADLVIQTWDVQNDGTKLVQIRFYPIATTQFTEKAHIVVKKVTDPVTDTDTLFNFTCDYRSGFSMNNNQFCLSGELEPDIYHVSEIVPDGWDLTDIDIVDLTGGSTYNLETGEATIDLTDGETVIVTYYNTQLGSITVEKVTSGDPGATQFEFDPSWSATTFSLGDGATAESDWLVAGTYTVEELPAIIAGWDLTAITITGDDNYTTGNVGTRTATIELDPGENVTVTFTNTYTAP